MDGALDVAADRQFLCADLAFYLCPFSDHNGRGAYLSLDVTKDSQTPWPVILPTIERPELIEEASCGCNALSSRAGRRISSCVDATIRSLRDPASLANTVSPQNGTQCRALR